MPALLVLTLLALCAQPAFAHGGHHGHDTSGAVVLLCAGAALIAAAWTLRRHWRTPAFVIGASAGLAVCTGLAAVYAALSGAPFARHMFGQMLLMDAAAPLAALSLARWVRVAPAWAAATHAAVMWGWHIPALYAATLTAPGVHIAMQGTFFLAGIAFWSSVLRARGSRGSRAVFWLFMTVMHTGFLGALLTFTGQPLYGAALPDQQLGGAVMWVMGTAVYAAAGLFVAARWFEALERGPLHERAA